jgi:GNAT superfamily N-acetyltransferase
MAANFNLSIQQFVDAWQVFAEAAPARSASSQPGLELIFAGVPISFFNAGVLTKQGISADQLRACAETARDWASKSGLPWMLIVTQEALATDTDAGAVLDACGYALAMPLYGMVTQSVTPISRMPDGLALRVADDDATCAAIMAVNSAAYAMPLDAANDVWGKAAFWTDHVEVLGSVGSESVSSAAVMKVSGHRYVALVATAPGRQRKGYADATMRYALEIARERYGNLPTFLHATEAGCPVYERMGYETVANHVAYMEKRFLEGH